MKRNAPNDEWSLAQLAEVTGCPARTIRYYIARGLLPPPHKAGPGAHYGREHARRIEQIRAWQAQGLTLAEIGHRLAAGPGTRPGLSRTAWWSYEIAPDVVVQVRAEVRPWRLRLIQRALHELADRLAAAPNRKETEDE